MGSYNKIKLQFLKRAFISMDFKYKFLLGAFLLFLMSSASGQLKRFHYFQPKMGSPLNIIFYTTDSLEAEKLAAGCFLLTDSLNAIYSDYLPASELNRLSNTSGMDSFVKLSPQLYGIILTGKKAWELSDHNFDITIGSLSQLWRKARKTNTFPSTEEVTNAKSFVGLQNIIIDTITHSVKILKQGLQLDLGGIAKGDVAQKLVDYLRDKGVRHALVDAGGDIAMSEAPPNATGWKVAVNIPENGEAFLSKNLLIQNKAVATSGDIYQYIVHNGRKYGHIINPKTGYGITSQRNVTVIADDGVTADWLASACSVLSLSEAKKIAGKLKAGLLITYEKGGKITYMYNKIFSQYWH